MMKIQCDISKITPIQSVVIMAVHDIYATQNLTRAMEVTSLDPLMVKLKNNLPSVQNQRLFADRVAECITGYKGRIEGDYLVIESANPVRTRRARRSKSDSDLQESGLQEVS